MNDICTLSQQGISEGGKNLDIYRKIASNPIFFERNRVFRVYKGGKLFHDFFGDEKLDGNYPEEWIASNVRALNKNSSNENEGLSKIEGTDIYFNDLMGKHKELLLGKREKFDILVKVLDSAIRLPIQAHPDKEYSRKYFNSDYGKAEAWIVLATRKDAKIYFGFKDQINSEEFIKVIEKTELDKNIMETMVNEVSVNEGDVYFIPSKIVHAIGYGCLILEIQEPTDFTIQPEKWCGDYHLDNYEMYLGLAQVQALECFDYSVYGKSSLEKGLKLPVLLEKNKFRTSESLISYRDTSCFAANRHRIDKSTFKLTNAPAIIIVTAGKGLLKTAGYEKTIFKGDYFFIPYSLMNKCSIQTEDHIEIIECLPSDLE